MSEELYCPNIRFETFDVIGRNGELNLDGVTAILVILYHVPDEIIKSYSEILLSAVLNRIGGIAYLMRQISKGQMMVTIMLQHGK